MNKQHCHVVAAQLKRVSFKNGAFYYRPPQEARPEWNGKAWVFIGYDPDEAMNFYHKNIGPSRRSVMSIEDVDYWSTLLFGRVKRRRKAGDLSKQDIKALLVRSQGHCEVTGLRLDGATGKGNWNPWQPSIDRINSEEPYTLGNCRVTCLAVNVAMGRWGADVLKEIAIALVGKRRRGFRE